MTLGDDAATASRGQAVELDPTVDFVAGTLAGELQ